MKFRKLVVTSHSVLLLILVGCFFAAIAGSVDPLNSILFASVLTIFTEGDRSRQEYLASLYAGLFVCLGVAALIGYTLEVCEFLCAAI